MNDAGYKAKLLLGAAGLGLASGLLTGALLGALVATVHSCPAPAKKR